MTGSGRHNKEKSRKDTRFFHDDIHEGTAARTRPVSFDEIMLRRKHKKLSEDVKVGVGPLEASTLPRDNVGENGSNSSDPGRSKHKTLDGTEKCVQEETLKASPRKKKENTLKDDSAYRDKGREDSTMRRDREDSTIKRKDREDITVKGREYCETEDNTMRRDRDDGRIKRKDIAVKDREYCETEDNTMKRDREDGTIKRKDREDITVKDREYCETEDSTIRRDKEDSTIRRDKEDNTIRRDKEDNTIRRDKEDSTIRRDKEDNTVRRDKEDRTIKRKDREAIAVKERENRETTIKLKDKLKKDSVSKAKGGADNQIHGRKRNVENLSNISERKTEKRYSRDFAAEDKHFDRSRRKSEREVSKRRYRDEDDETNRDRIAVKKHEPGRRHDYEISEKNDRKESSKSHYEEPRGKRRRSRSREHGKDINRRSMSASPRENKQTFKYRREHVETISQTLTDGAGRQPSDMDRGRMSSNGLSSHYRRHGGSKSGLGGYSPRKRRSEAGFRTPSPIHRSPEKKSAGWDFPPSGTDGKKTSSVLPNLSSSNQTSNIGDSDSVAPAALSTAKALAGVSPIAISTKKSSSDSLQLTQVIQPMKRLHIENVPVSATEKALMEWLNNFLLSLDGNHIHGAHPCISCIIQKEKGQAVVEFLTPEDASAALTFDGRSFSGSVLNIRRPEYFVDMATGDPEKSVAAVDSLADTVQDSPHKIFVGGIPKALSSKMVLEIVSTFGPLKAYHFEVNNDQPYAFLEFVDQSVTLKACAGLSGMKLGGQVLTAVQSVPHASSLETADKTPFYGIPAHAKPLLTQPTRILKLKNVFSAEALLLLPESEVEELLEDIQLECSRFGAVKSVNVIKQGSSPVASPDARAATENVRSTGRYHNSEVDEKSAKSEDVGHEPGVNTEETSENNRVTEKAVIGDCIDDGNKALDDHEEVTPPEQCLVDVHMVDEELASESIPERKSPENPSTLEEFPDDKVADTIQTKLKTEGHLGSDKGNDEGSVGSRERTEIATEKGDDEKSDPERVCVLERGSVLVEFRRCEASCMAAHSLQGRTFGEHIVAVEYVDEDLYKARFPK